MLLIELLLGLAFLAIALTLLFKVFLPALKPKEEPAGDIDSLIDESEEIISRRDKVKKKVEKSSEKLNTIKKNLN